MIKRAGLWAGLRRSVIGHYAARNRIEAAMLNRAGSKMSDVPVTAAQAGGTHQINLSLAAIPAGEYLVEITVNSASGEAKELVPFRVGS